MDNSITGMNELVKMLNDYTKAYDEGRPQISDKEWDDLYFKLIDLEKSLGVIHPESPTNKIAFSCVSALPKVEHNHPMLSLNKTKSISDIEAFVGNKDYIAMPKMDGLTCSLLYQNGQLIRAETRGNGSIGENITHNAYVIPSIPKHIPFTEDIVIDGEIICSYDNFEKVSSDYKNPRNYAAGSIRLLDADECHNRRLTFVAWDIIKGFENCTSLSQKLTKLTETTSFRVIPFAIKMPNTDISAAIDFCKTAANKLSYPIDGIVFKYDDCDYYNSLGATDHHFRGGIAYKFYDEEYTTKLTNIEWSLGRTGVLTPIAIFEPIDIDGTEVSRASLHNISIMEELWGEDNWFNGLTVSVIKSNQIIPQITKVELTENVYNKEVFNIPSKCPVCGGDTKISISASGVKTLICTNPSCEGKFANKLDHFCSKKGLDIKGLSKTTIEKLIDWGYIGNFEELFSLSSVRDEWIKQAGFGEKSVDKILDSIEERRNNVTMAQYIAAMGIPFIGLTAAKKLEKELHSYDEFREEIKNGFDFSTLDSFGDEMNKAIHNFDYSEFDNIAKHYLNFNHKDKEEQNNENSLEGLTFVITGKLKFFKNRDMLKELIENLGGVVSSSVTSKTDYLINNDVMSNTAKNVAAQRLNKPIVTEEEFLNLFNIKI